MLKMIASGVLSRCAALIIVLCVAACASSGGSHNTAYGLISIAGADYMPSFHAAQNAALDTGLIIASANAETGVIMAINPFNRMKKGTEADVRITVTENRSGTNIAVNGPQEGLFNAGDFKNTVQDFCQALGELIKSVRCLAQ